MEKKVHCLHPVIILNPLASELIAEHANYTLRGHQVTLSRHRHLLYEFKLGFLNPKRLKIKHEDIETCFITSMDTGEVFPLYLEVPCGNCIYCKETKVNAFVQRCKLETQCYNCKPIFLTLTYENEKVPKDGVSVRDAQLFFKRLRINLYRSGHRDRIRYVLVSEYGRNFHRPHYHAILWNVHQTDLVSYKRVVEIIEKSWNNGFIMSRLVEPSNDKAFYYTAKYLRKDCDIPEGCNETFLLSSNRGGGIGSAFLDSIAHNVIKRLDSKPQFVNKWNGRVEEIRLNRFLLNKLLPSFSRSLPAGTKRYVRDFLISYKILKDRNVNIYCNEKVEQIIHFFRPYFYCPELETSEIKASMEGSTALHYRTLCEAEMQLSRIMRKGRDFFEHARYLDQRRKLFLEKLFENQEDIDVYDLAYQYNRRREISKQLEVL